MQAGGAFSSPIPYHAPPSAPQDHDLKRQYLSLLPPQQIIDICLNFDIHVPPYVKGSIWPIDLNAAIASMQKSVPPQADAPEKPPPAVSTTTPAMDSLADSTAPAQPEPTAAEPQPPDRASATPGPSSRSQSIAPMNIPPQHPAYSVQPYGYAHPQTAYPHAPYYPPPPPGYTPYPHASSYPYTSLANGYTVPPPGFPSASSSIYSAPSLSHLPQSQEPYSGTAGDDLPSYEEMIVEALTDTADPEGCAPKDLFTWMASRYPLQSNFRPSASQALQKAYKRGRFEKSSGGKYRLNATWEGGNTSRRTTRRPQTQTQNSTPAAATSSPFTHAPLVHHHQHQTPASQHPSGHPPYQSQGFGYSYAPSAAYPGYPQQPAPNTSPTTDERPPAPSEGDAGDAYEAAQNILKAINFGSLLQLPAEDNDEPTRTADELAPGATVENPSTHPLPAVMTPTVSGALDGAAPSNLSNNASTLPENPRAALQAQLALLAAQLTEFAQTEDEVIDVDPPPEKVVEPEELEDSDDDDMEEVI